MIILRLSTTPGTLCIKKIQCNLFSNKKFTCKCAGTCMYLHACTCVVCVSTCAYVSICVHTSVSVHVCMRVYTHAYAYIHTYIHAYIYECACICVCVIHMYMVTIKCTKRKTTCTQAYMTHVCKYILHVPVHCILPRCSLG